jgi:WD40 repeat protein
MHLLPRSPRGTWLLAAAVWAAVCAAVWLAVPEVPRAEWTLPRAGMPVAFLPGGVLVTADAADPQATRTSAAWRPAGPLRLWDAATGRLPRTVSLPSGCRFRSVRPSRDGRRLALVGRSTDDAGLWLLDLADGSAAPVPAVTDVDDCAFGPDDAWLLCAAEGGVYRLPLPDLTRGPPVLSRRRLALSFDVALAPDGRAAAVRDGEAAVVRVWAADAPPRAAIPVPPVWAVSGLGLSAGGGVMAMCEVTPRAGGRFDLEARCWETATGRELLVAAHPQLPVALEMSVPPVRRVTVLTPDGRTLAVLGGAPDRSPDARRLTLWDVAGGAVRAAIDLPADAAGCPAAANLLSPDGRVAVVPVRRRPWTKRLGLRWPTGPAEEPGAALYAADSGGWLGRVMGGLADAAWAPDSSVLATFDDADRRVRVWDVPPRKPAGWFAVAAAAFAAPSAWLARRRVGRLRREGADSVTGGSLPRAGGVG